jgi:hypothetical protein
MTRLRYRNVPVNRTLAALFTFMGAAACVVAVTLAFLAVHDALRDWYLQTVAFPRAFYFEQSGNGIRPIAVILRFIAEFLELNFDTVVGTVEMLWHVIRVVVVSGAIILWNKRDCPEPLLIAACLTPALWFGAYPSANYMHQWWMTSFSIAPFIYCVHRTIDVMSETLRLDCLVRPDWLPTTVALTLVFWSGLEERWQYASQRATTLTETFDEPRMIKGIHTDPITLRAFDVLYSAIRNFKQHHPSARIVSKDHCDGFTNCVPESLLWLSFIDDNRRNHPIYWPIPVLADRLYSDYLSGFWNTVYHDWPLIVDSWNGSFRASNTPGGYELLAGIPTETGYWYLYAPMHPSSREHGEIPVRLEPRFADADDGALTANSAARIRFRRADAVAAKWIVRTDARITDGAHDAVRGRLYTWPAGVYVPSLPSAYDPLDPDAARRARIVGLYASRWVIRGSASAPFSDLIRIKSRIVLPGEYFFATGYLHEGGFSLGLQSDDRWSGFVNVQEVGAFTVVLKPSPGRYNVVVANNVTTTWRQLIRAHGPAGILKLLTGESLPNSFEIDSAGWTSSSNSIPTR